MLLFSHSAREKVSTWYSLIIFLNNVIKYFSTNCGTGPWYMLALYLTSAVHFPPADVSATASSSQPFTLLGNVLGQWGPPTRRCLGSYNPLTHQLNSVGVQKSSTLPHGWRTQFCLSCRQKSALSFPPN